MFLSAVSTAVGLTLMQKLPGLISGLTGPDNLSDLTSPTRNDFVTVVEDTLLGEPYLPNIMQSTLSLVSGYFLSSISLTVNIPGVDVVDTLDRLNANRSAARTASNTFQGLANTTINSLFGKENFVGCESFEYGLPDHSVAIEMFSNQVPREFVKVGIESYQDQLREQELQMRIQKLSEEITRGRAQGKRDKDKIAKMLSNMDKQSARDEEKFRADLERMRLDREDKEAVNKTINEINDLRLEQMKAQGASTKEIEEVKLQNMKASAARDSDKFTAEQAILELRKQMLELQVADSKKGPKDQGKFGFGKGTMDTLKEVSNLAVGKVLDVTFERNGNSVVVPVTINLAATDTDSESMENIITYQSRDSSFSERKFKVKAGDISGFKDLYMCQDMKEEAIKNAIKDKSGFFENMIRRSRGNFWSGLLGLSPSLNNASAVLIMTSDTVKRASAKLGGDFDNYKVRQKAFAKTAAMIFVVVDQKWNEVVFYHRGVQYPTKLDVRDLSRGQKGANDDVDSILKAYSAGAAPVL